MLSTQNSPSSALLSVAANNWGTINKDLLAECLYEFGKSGLQIRTQVEIPLTPFASEPTIIDMQRSVHSGEPIPGRYVYHRREMTDKEAIYCDSLSLEDQTAFTDDLPLSDRGSRDFRDDISTYARALSERTASDAAALKRLNNITSPDSKTIMLSHPDYAAYLVAPDHKRSLPYYLMLLAIHRTGDASIKYKRTMNLMTASQGDEQLESWVAFLDNAFDQFEVDFEDPDNQGFMRLSEFKSFLFLRGCNRAQFQRLYDEQLRATPSGRFPDTKELMAQFLQFNTNNKMSFAADPASSQLSAFVARRQPSAAAPTSAQPTFVPATASRPPRKFPDACIHCLRDCNVKRFGHSSYECTRRPDAPARRSDPPARRPDTPASQALLASSAHDARLSAIEDSLTSISSYLVSLAPASDVPSDPAQALLAATSQDQDNNSRDTRLESLEVSLASIAAFLTTIGKSS